MSTIDWDPIWNYLISFHVPCVNGCTNYPGVNSHWQPIDGRPACCVCGHWLVIPKDFLQRPA